MKATRPKTRGARQVDRRVSDEDVFEHVIVGVRINLLLQTLRDAGVRAANPKYSGPRRAHTGDDRTR
ncbi:MAG TPA: hypothetical protein VLV86_07115 [Vicinamibacterales bacterium]|nr:hypothetical protein [Vicinamibacterales bacterium]